MRFLCPSLRASKASVAIHKFSVIFTFWVATQIFAKFARLKKKNFTQNSNGYFANAQYDKSHTKNLKFKCAQCKNCCCLEGGVVLLSKADLEKLCKWAELTEEQFRKVYCRKLENANGKTYLCLKDKNKTECIFWNKEKGCEAYNARPVQCRTYPFWTKILESKSSWEAEKTF